ncbi:hypothetical protein [Salinimicrobium flavum]|uniref:Outer membrane protein beta-barrel domain-containing protein n=1 Tax=Salinimicrobium flavum TaxID=1737065 RepID=A0ABW5IUJ7_9FLAO
MNLKHFFLITGLFFLSFHGTAQQLWDGQYNRLGLQAGANRFDIVTNNLPVNPGISWTAGFTTRASFYEDFQFVYGINFYDFKMTMDGREKIELSSPAAEIEYTMIGVQANFFGSYKLYDHYLSVEAGPVLQVNGKMDARQDKEYYYVGNYDVNAIDLEKVGTVNFNLAFGLSGGFETFKFWAQYQYGLNNILGKLNDQGLKEKDGSFPTLKGHMSMISGGIVIFL